MEMHTAQYVVFYQSDRVTVWHNAHGTILLYYVSRGNAQYADLYQSDRVISQ